MKFKSEGIISVVQSFPDYLVSKFPKHPYVFYMLTSVRHKSQIVLFENPANPYKRISISTKRINKYPKNYWRHKGLGQILGGDWDQSNISKITEDVRYVGFKQRFIHNYDWEETVFYEQKKKEFENSGENQFNGYNSFEEFKNVRLQYIDDLYESIQQEGYQSNFENDHQAPKTDIRSGKLRHIHQLEPLVAIGRDGEFYLCEGFHRVIIAKLLDIDSIPVNVLARHQHWQTIREGVAQTDYPKQNKKIRDYLDHPDLQDLLKDS